MVAPHEAWEHWMTLFCFVLFKMDGTNSGGFLFVSDGTSKWLAWHSQPKTYSLEKGEGEGKGTIHGVCNNNRNRSRFVAFLLYYGCG